MRRVSLLYTGITVLLMASGCLQNDWNTAPTAPDPPQAGDTFCFSCPGDSVSPSHPIRARLDSTVTASDTAYIAVIVLYADSSRTAWFGDPKPGPYRTWLVGPSFDPTMGWGDRSLTPRATELRPYTERFVIPCPAQLDTITFSPLFTDTTGTVVGWPFVLDSEATTRDRSYRLVIGPGVVMPLPNP